VLPHRIVTMYAPTGSPAPGSGSKLSVVKCRTAVAPGLAARACANVWPVKAPTEPEKDIQPMCWFALKMRAIPLAPAFV